MGDEEENARNLKIARGKTLVKELENLGILLRQEHMNAINEDKMVLLTAWLEKKEEAIREESPDCDNCEERAGEPTPYGDLD